MKRILLIALNSVLLAAAGYLIVSGRLDGVAASMPSAPYLLGTALGLVIVAILALMRAAKTASRDLTLLLGLMLLASAAVHLTMTDPGGIFLTSPLYPAYGAILLLYAGCANPGGWVIVVASLGLFETAAAVYRFQGRSREPVEAMLFHFGLLAVMSSVALLASVMAAGHRKIRPAPSSPNSPAEEPDPAKPAEGSRTAPYAHRLTNETAEFSLTRVTDPQLHEGTVVEGLLESIVFFMQRNFDAYSALGFIYDGQRQTFSLNAFRSRGMSVIKSIEIPLGRGVVGRIGTEKRSFMSGDLSVYGQELFYYTSGELVNSILAVPIISDDKELLGALVVDSKNSRVFTDHHKEAMRRFSLLAAALITNARMRIHQQRTAKQFRILYESSQKFTTALSVDQVFSILLEMTGLMTPYIRATVVTPELEQHRGRVCKLAGDSSRVSEGFEFPLNSGLYSFALLKKKPVNIGDLQLYSGKYYRFLPDEPRDRSVRSIIILPFLDDESRCLGVLSVESDQPNQFHGELEQILSTLAGNASVAITRALLYQKMEHLATTDGLTGLNNHRFFQEQLAHELARSVRYSRPLALLLMDIDHFKSFNDSYGHPVGDLVLREIARCIGKAIRVNDIPARYGGEEFAVILPESSAEAALVTAERIRQTIESNIIASQGRELRVTMSIGCSCFPDHAQDKALLISSADKALYFSKENGRNRTTLFRRGM